MDNKIGIVTLWKGNYGSQLQCYATKQLLKKYGYEGVLLQYQENNKLIYFERGIKNVLFRLRCIICYPEQKDNITNILTTGRRLSQSSLSKSLEGFTNVYLQPVYVGKKDMKRLGKSREFKLFFAGSDQVWNGACVDDFMPGFLQDVPKEKRIAFAASFGAAKIAVYNEKRFKKRIANFNKIFVRERGASETILGITGIECPVILDPVLQLEREDWEALIGGEKTLRHISVKYIVANFLDAPASHIVELVNEVARILSAQIVLMPYDYDVFRNVEHVGFHGDPIEYLKLIKNAEYVITDSFHGMAFSIIFEKNFLVTQRQYTHKYDQSERIVSLLEICGLKDRFSADGTIGEDVVTKKIDYAHINTRIKAFKNFSQECLESVLN